MFTTRLSQRGSWRWNERSVLGIVCPVCVEMVCKQWSVDIASEKHFQEKFKEKK